VKTSLVWDEDIPARYTKKWPNLENFQFVECARIELADNFIIEKEDKQIFKYKNDHTIKVTNVAYLAIGNEVTQLVFIAPLLWLGKQLDLKELKPDAPSTN
jgi:hypothetical protein